jgi:hypothetical protein
MDERMRFVARLMEGEKMAVLCREFDISRKTGLKRSKSRLCWYTNGHSEVWRRPCATWSPTA